MIQTNINTNYHNAQSTFLLHEFQPTFLGSRVIVFNFFFYFKILFIFFFKYLHTLCILVRSTIHEECNKKIQHQENKFNFVFLNRKRKLRQTSRLLPQRQRNLKINHHGVLEFYNPDLQVLNLQYRQLLGSRL